MKRQLHALLALWTSAAIVISGCAPTQPFFFFEDGDMSHYVGMATQIEHPDVDTESLAEVEHAGQPFTVTDPQYRELWELSLEDAVRYALENSKVIRSLGGRQASFGGQRSQQDESPETVLRAPQQTPTVYDPAITESDPNFGVEGALSAFDAQLGSSIFWEKNDRPQNLELREDTNDDGVPDALDPNIERFGFARIRRQDLGQFNTTLSKRTATGMRVAVAANTIYEYSNSGRRELPSDWNQNIEFQLSQPLLQGGGILYNRIAGPFDPFNGTGNPNFDGVLIARIRTDVSLADFEAGVRNLVNDVEGAYWNLYFGYRNLAARKVGRDSALATWRKVDALAKEGGKGGEADKEAQAREQYFFFRAEVETALSDLFRAENRLRYIIGLGATDGRLIAPITEPTTARVEFDWNEIHAESQTRSVELRQQRWRIKQRELELMASKNLLLPRLDVVARHRWLGLGDDLINSDGRAYNASNEDLLAGTDAFSTLVDGNFQESQIGLQFNMPLGFRRELATVRNQQWLVARERTILQEQELELSHQLTEAVRILDTSYTLMQTNFNRVVAAEKQVEAVQSLFDTGLVTLDLLLDAQRRLADALSSGYRAQADYNRNIAQVHFRKGSLLEYNGVYLAEGPWPGKAYFDAHRHARARDAAYFLDYGFTRPDVVSRGPVDQDSGDFIPHDGMIEGREFGAEEIPTPAEGQPTPAAPMPAGPTEAAPEEMPSPGPATMKSVRNRMQYSKASRRHEGRQASYDEEVSTAPARKRDGAFDWKIDRSPGATEDDSANRKTAPAASEDEGMTVLRVTASSDSASTDSGSSARAEELPAAGSSQHTRTRAASGWKKAER